MFCVIDPIVNYYKVQQVCSTNTSAKQKKILRAEKELHFKVTWTTIFIYINFTSIFYCIFLSSVLQNMIKKTL